MHDQLAGLFVRPHPGRDNATYLLVVLAAWAPVLLLGFGFPARETALVVAALVAVLVTAVLVRLRTRLSAIRRAVAHERASAAAEMERMFDERTRLEQDMADAQRRANLAALGSNEGVWECELATGEVWHSPGFHEHTGFDPELLTRGLAWFDNHVHPDDAERWQSAMASHVLNRTSYSLHLRLRNATETFRWFRLRGQAEWNLAGEVTRLSGSLADIHEQRHAEERLRESEESFRTLSAASPIGIFKADAGGRCVYCNRRWQDTFGLSEAEALGDGWFEGIDPEDREAVRSEWQMFTRGGDAFDREFRMASADGSARWSHCRANRVIDRRGRAAGFVGTVENITQQRAAALALAEAHDRAMQAARAKSEFLANMSHEIRTPLNGVIGMTELLQNTPLTDEQGDFVRTINTSADALLNIINDILDFSKIEAGKMRIERVPHDLRGIAEDVADMLALRSRERGLEIVLAIEPDLPRRLVGDPTRIRQIVINLVTNAIKFTELGEVVIGAQCIERSGENCRVRISVRDSGIGIPPDRLGAVFESFTQADGSMARRYGGTGLGLTICRQLAELMGGEIHVTSKVGEGSEFWVEVPMGIAPDDGEHLKAIRGLSGARVLVVDDHPINRRILVETLQAWGARPVSASDGEEALAAVAGEGADPFKVVLLDYRMPGWDGLETAARLRAHGGPARSFVVLSSVGSAGLGEAAQQAPVDLWLTKPVREAALHRALCQVLGRGETGTAAAKPAETGAVGEFADLAILLAEDNEVNRKVALRMLGRFGCDADIAVNGNDAVRSVQSRDYDLVFMDCQMPEMDGFEATRAIRTFEARTGAHAYITAMTANAMEGDRERCLECGMDDYVAKPVKLERIAEQLRAAHERRARRAA